MPGSPKPDRPTPASPVVATGPLIPSCTVNDAPEASRPLLEDMAAVSPTGLPLNLQAQLAAAPAVVHAYVALRRASEQHSSFEPRTRIVLMLAAAGAFGDAFTTEHDDALRPVAVGA